MFESIADDVEIEDNFVSRLAKSFSNKFPTLNSTFKIDNSENKINNDKKTTATTASNPTSNESSFKSVNQSLEVIESSNLEESSYVSPYFSVDLSKIKEDLFDNQTFETSDEMKQKLFEKTKINLNLRESNKDEKRTMVDLFPNAYPLLISTTLNDLVEGHYIDGLRIVHRKIASCSVNVTDLLCQSPEIVTMIEPIVTADVFSIHDNYIRLIYQNYEFGAKIFLNKRDLKKIITGKKIMQNLSEKYLKGIAEAASEKAYHILY